MAYGFFVGFPHWSFLFCCFVLFWGFAFWELVDGGGSSAGLCIGIG
jgi:hypothetical protein